MNTRLDTILKIGLALTFIGHGYFALNGRMAWLEYIAFFGFSLDTAKNLLPIIGGLDMLVAVGILTIKHPLIFLWCTLWTFTTAILRPLTGESWFEFIERGSFYGVSLFLYIRALEHQKSRKETPTQKPSES